MTITRHGHPAAVLDQPRRPRSAAAPSAASPAAASGSQLLKEQLTFTGDDTALAALLLSVMGAFAGVERALIKERQREGIALAKQRGAYRGRRKALSPAQISELTAHAATGAPKAAPARTFGISRETVYQ